MLIAAALMVWSLLRDGDERSNVFNDGLRGSKPPAGEQVPDLAAVEGLDPAVDPPAQLRGDALQLVATCLDCRSGEVFGGYLGRLTDADVPDGARVVLVGWGGELDAWREQWQVDPELVELHAARDEATAVRLRELFDIAPRGGAPESGIAFLYDTRGRWRSTYFLGQLNREDITHDLEQLARD